MKGNFHVRFLVGEGVTAMSLPYPTILVQSSGNVYSRTSIDNLSNSIRIAACTFHAISFGTGSVILMHPSASSFASPLSPLSITACNTSYASAWVAIAQGNAHTEARFIGASQCMTKYRVTLIL